MSLSTRELERQISELYILEETEKNKDTWGKWITVSLRDLYELCSRHRQTKYPKDLRKTGYRYATRVIRLKAYVSEKDLNDQDFVFCDGLFIAVEGAFIDRSLMDRYFRKVIQDGSWIKDEDIDNMGLPHDLRYETIHLLPNGQGFVLKKNEFNEYVKSMNSWEFLEV